MALLEGDTAPGLLRGLESPAGDRVADKGDLRKSCGSVGDGDEEGGGMLLGTLGRLAAAAAAADSKWFMAPGEIRGGEPPLLPAFPLAAAAAAAATAAKAAAEDEEGGGAGVSPPEEVKGSRKETMVSFSLPTFCTMADPFLDLSSPFSSSLRRRPWESTQWLSKVCPHPKESLQAKHMRMGLTGTVDSSTSGFLPPSAASGLLPSPDRSLAEKTR